jgi:hypothetical protein
VSGKYEGAPGTLYLVRPDLHVCARWRRPTVEQVTQALRRAAGSCGTFLANISRRPISKRNIFLYM